jgi:DNA invertase Pin-like site-specific DNA recombinase
MGFEKPLTGGMTPMRFGYVRVSTDDQNTELQLTALKEAGCKRVFTDTSGGARPDRPGLQEALSHMREGDALVVWKQYARSSGRIRRRLGGQDSGRGQSA